MGFRTILLAAAFSLILSCRAKEAVVEENGANIPDNPAKPAAGIETGTWWSVEEWANRGKITRMKSNDRKVLRLNFDGGNHEKAVYKYLPGISVPPDQR